MLSDGELFFLSLQLLLPLLEAPLVAAVFTHVQHLQYRYSKCKLVVMYSNAIATGYKVLTFESD